MLVIIASCQKCYGKAFIRQNLALEYLTHNQVSINILDPVELVL